MGERISYFQAYRLHVELATRYLVLAKEVQILQECGSEDWAIALRAFLAGLQQARPLQMDRVNPTWYLEKVDALKVLADTRGG